MFRPEGGGPMGGTAIAFKKNEKRTVFTDSILELLGKFNYNTLFYSYLFYFILLFRN